jgi:serine protease Do
MLKSVFVSLVVLVAAVPAFAQDSGWIGVYIADQTDRGVLVRSVEPNSPAEKGGLRANDVIMQYNKEDVVGVLQLTRLVSETPVGRTVDVTVRRDSKEQTVKVTTEKAPPLFGLGLRGNRTPDIAALRDRAVRTIPRLDQLLPGGSVITAGVRVESLTPQLREYFGVKGEVGVLVSNVQADSAASKAGLRAGDVVISVAGRTVSSPADFTREFRTGSGAVTLRVVRDKQERDVRLGN